MKRILFLFVLVLLAVLACQLTQEDKVEHTLSLDGIFDSLSMFDSVDIQLRELDGGLIGTLFSEKVDSSQELRNLSIAGYNGKSAIISITGYIAGELVYKVDREFDGSTNTIRKTTLFKMPVTTLNVDSEDLRIFEGDSAKLPGIKVTPANLADATLLWSSLDQDVLSIVDSIMIGRARGKAKISVKLKSDLAKEIIFTITVAPNPLIPDSLFLGPETLFVAAKGAPKKLKVGFSPVTAKQSLSWHSSQSSTALVSETGAVYGVNKGMARIWAISQIKATVTDSVWVSVSERIPVTGVSFLEDSLSLFIGGSTEPLVTAVIPNLANPEMDFTIRDPSKVELTGERIKGLQPGGTWVVAVSRDNPSLMDSIRVEVLGTQKVDSIVAAPEMIQVYTGGQDFALTTNVFPSSAYAKVQWNSLDKEIATVDASGHVSAVAPGLARIVCTSLVDSLKKDTVRTDVKQDVPTLIVGGDTTITQGQTLVYTPSVNQEYGGIHSFKWDVDGQAGWDDSADALKTISYKYLQEKQYPVAFYVRDGEANWDTVRFTVTVKSSPMLVVIVSPGRDTIVNTPSMRIGYTVNGEPRIDTIGLRNGENIVVVDTADEKGMGRDSVRITLDTNAPVVRIKSPSQEQAFNTDSVNVEWSVDEIPQSTLLTAQLGASDGKRVITRTFTDPAGNSGEATVSVVRDTKPPKVTIASPTDLSHTKNGMASVIWYADSIRQTDDTTYILIDGPNIITRKAKDLAGNSDSTSVLITYWSKPPVIEILTPTDSTVTDKKRITITWTANGAPQKADTLEDLDEGANPIVRRFVDPAGQTGSDSLLVFFNPNVPDVQITAPLPGTVTNLDVLPVSWTVNGLLQGTDSEPLPIEGENTLTRRFKDSLGYEGVAMVKVIRDTGKPNPPALDAAVRLITTANPNAPMTWSWQSGGDNTGGAGMKTQKAYRYQMNAQTPEETSLEAFTLSGSPDGSFSLRVQEQDKAGNWSEYSASVVIILDKTSPSPPYLTGNSPSSDPRWSWLNMGGGGAGIYRFRLDDEPYSEPGPANTFNPHQVSDANHTLNVQQQDEHGNWSLDAPLEIKMDRSYPTIPSGGNTACMQPGSPTDTVKLNEDSEGFHPIFDGKSFNGWWENCKTAHSAADTAFGAIWGIDPNSRAIFVQQNTNFAGSVMMTNNSYTNYELVIDLWAKFGNDSRIYNRAKTNGSSLASKLSYISASSVGGAFGESGFESLNSNPYVFSSEFTLASTTLWTNMTAGKNPTAFGCSAGGCVSADWANIWNSNGWNQIRIEVFGNPARVRTYLRKFGSSTWTPISDIQSSNDKQPSGFIALQVHGGAGRWGSSGNWYRNIKIRELTQSGEPVKAP